MWRKPFLILALSAASGAAWGQVECAKLVEDLRPRCEQVNRMNQLCAGLEADKHKACERKNMNITTREDCSRAPAPAQAICEQHNRAIAELERCRDKTGPQRDACTRENVSRPGARQL